MLDFGGICSAQSQAVHVDIQDFEASKVALYILL